MATPTVVVQHGVQTPTLDAPVPVAGSEIQYRLTIVLGGTPANVLTDWTTLAAQNFACHSAVLSWDRAG